jgi:hypothetical protein
MAYVSPVTYTTPVTCITPLPYKKVVAFDIGIKNLAFCVLEQGTTVLGLENCNLLEPVIHIICTHCKSNASYTAADKPYCKRHIPKTFLILPELTAKKPPTNKVLQELVKTHGLHAAGSTNAKYVEALASKCAFHLEQPKQENASKLSLETIHDSLRQFVQEKWIQFSGSTHVLLENQPAFKNPHMKSVQVLLFATLREQFLKHDQHPAYHLVHAKKKVASAEKGDAGYAERKQKSEERLIQLFEQGHLQASPFYDTWKQAKKKSDMADALCMAVDNK